MIAVIQRVYRADVTIEGRTSGCIDAGLVILLGVAVGDDETDADFLVDKISGLRIFSDDEGKMNISIKDISGSALVVSQFTLCGDWRKGRRPSFTNAARPDEGERLYEYFCKVLKVSGVPVETGEFGTMMDVSLVNNGPVTFVLDSKQK
ncbi:MAG: D-tyrosyl-tRNA(Tyr) deacylase [Candidatus Marinimicrobia bacterium]|nr:D-tyrosyl-tRNA(Tyr) deacylase [Candidatus Neomarinimicrobiota bacterium]